MKITVDASGKRTVDFMGASLPDGRKIEDILNENEAIRKQVIKLKEELEDAKDVVDKALDKLKIPANKRRWIKTVIELIDLVL
ncbi:MAG: hypothetical protein ACOYJ8_03795 [Patescibacteria group bacterium]|jgi:hypothetical protein